MFFFLLGYRGLMCTRFAPPPPQYHYCTIRNFANEQWSASFLMCRNFFGKFRLKMGNRDFLVLLGGNMIF